MKIWIVDAFTSQAYKGNPAAVCVIQEFPSDQICQKIAMEINLSETAFVKPLSKNHFHIRWFTPEVEVNLCGHATLASSIVLKYTSLCSEENIVFDSRSGPLRVSFSDDDVTLDFPLQKRASPFDIQLIKENFGKIKDSLKIEGDLILELSSEEEVRMYIPNFAEIEKIDCRGLILTAQSSEPYDFVSRFFAPKEGINEDPVTGSAHCKLAYYWQKRLGKSVFTAYQASKRGGEIQMKIAGDRVFLTGQAVLILEGKWLGGL